MPAIDFPASPTLNQEYSFEGRTWRWNGTGWEVKEYPAALLAGTAANPSLYFSGDTNTGLYSPGADQAAITTGGTQKFTIDSLDGNAIIENSFPTIRPSLDLAFALTKVLDPRITFTRSSDGTYTDANGVLRTATTNIPRFDHAPTTGESLGLLVEEARTNNFAWSNSANNNETWNNVGTLLNLASGQSDPAGGTTGIRATDADSASGGTFLQRTSLANLTASTTVTYSIWIKPISCPNVSFTLSVFANVTTDSITATFAVSGTAITGTSSTTASGTGSVSGASFEGFPNGWYRCRLTGIPSTVTMADVRARINLGSYQRAAGTARFDWYGAQLEVGAFATSYIPTSGTTVTRSADVASITGTNFSSWYRQDQGTVFAEYRTPASGTRGVAGFNDNTANERLALFTNGTDPKMIVVDGGVTQVDLNGGTIAASTMAKSALAYAANDFAFVHAGGTAVTDTSGTLPTVDRLFLGADQAGNYQNGRIRRLRFWPARLSNTTLQAITK